MKLRPGGLRATEVRSRALREPQSSCLRAPNTQWVLGTTMPEPLALPAAMTAPLRHQRHIGAIIVVTEECLKSAISALGDMMRKARRHNSSNPWHGAIVLPILPVVKPEFSMVSPDSPPIVRCESIAFLHGG